jgi:DNA-binding transcriptional ArsR family regulator
MISVTTPPDPVFKALADPVRREILVLLRDRPMTVQPLADRFAISRPAISRHLRVLGEADLVEATPRGRANVYGVRLDAIREAEEWLRSLWRGRLVSLKNLVEKNVE